MQAKHLPLYAFRLCYFYGLMELCPQCKQWDLAAGDVVCSWCGHRLVGIQAELARSRFLSSEIPPPVRLVLSNNSNSASLTINAIDASDPWIRIDGGKKRPFTLSSNSSEELTIRVDPLSLPPDSYHAGSIIIRSNVGVEKLPIEVLPPPLMSLSAYSGSDQRKTCSFDIILDNRDLERSLVRIAAEQGVVEIENISLNQEWVKVRLPGATAFPISLDARKAAYLDVFLDVDESALTKKSTSLPADYEASLKIERPDFTGEEKLTFKCWNPPALWPWHQGGDVIQAWAGQSGEVVLTLQNSEPGKPQTGLGNAPLQVAQIDVRRPGGEPCAWLRTVTDISKPIVIPGGDRREIKFAFETDAECKGSAEKLGIGRHRVTLVLTTNALEAPLRKIPLEIKVQPITDFDGVLAIDFGTSNTCCAVFERATMEHKILAIDQPIHNDNPATAPTVIQYLDQAPDGTVRVKFGAEIEALRLNAKVLRSMARSLKRRLGGGEPFEILFFFSDDEIVEYSPQQVVADYLRAVRRVVEGHHPGVRFRDIVITHPSRFKMRQIMELEEAVRSAFGAEAKISLLPEPVAAALGFIVSDKEALAKDRYVIGVFDFGGGTTDLSLIEVVNRRVANIVEVRPQQLNCSGHWFGGEDLTQYVYDHGLEACRKHAAEKYPNESLLAEPEKYTRDGNQRENAIENHGRLMQWAEQTKLLLLKQGDTDKPPVKLGLFPDLLLSLWSSTGPQQRSFPYSRIVPKRADLDRFLRPHLEKAVADLAKLVSVSKLESLDYIWLSGKPSTIPLVREVLAQQFPQAQPRLAPEPKECVVEGACILDRFRGASSVVLTLEQSGFVRTTSRLGIEDAGQRTFTQMIGLGEPISNDGLKGYYENYPLQRGAIIRLLENESLSENSTVNNSDLTEIGTFEIDPAQNSLPKTGFVISRLELQLTRDFTPTLIAHVPEAGSVPFVMKRTQRV